MKTNKSIFLLLLLLCVGIMVGCSDDDGGDMDGDDEEEEVINEVVLTFTPEGGGDAITATWFDSDGEGTTPPTIDAINLVEGQEYELTLELANTLGTEVEDVTAEILAEDDEHMFFFAFTNDIFSDPAGDGNEDSRADDVNYNDQDENGLPVGLSTQWTAGGHTDAAGVFTVILKHQPGEKSADSDIDNGGTDIDIDFPINIVEDPNAEEEEINRIVLTFTPEAGGDAITATWFDADGEGVTEQPVIDAIELDANTEYEMSITLTNTLGAEDEDVTAEVLAEDDEHMFFFAFTNNIFSDPTGDGNEDNRADDVNYNDQDENSLPVGLSTQWTTGAATSAAGEFKVILKHQPGQKTADSDVDDGGTDVEITFDININ